MLSLSVGSGVGAQVVGDCLLGRRRLCFSAPPRQGTQRSRCLMMTPIHVRAYPPPGVLARPPCPAAKEVCLKTTPSPLIFRPPGMKL